MDHLPQTMLDLRASVNSPQSILGFLVIFVASISTCPGLLASPDKKEQSPPVMEVISLSKACARKLCSLFDAIEECWEASLVVEKNEDHLHKFAYGAGHYFDQYCAACGTNKDYQIQFIQDRGSWLNYGQARQHYIDATVAAERERLIGLAKTYSYQKFVQNLWQKTVRNTLPGRVRAGRATKEAGAFNSCVTNTAQKEFEKLYCNGQECPLTKEWQSALYDFATAYQERGADRCERFLAQWGTLP